MASFNSRDWGRDGKGWRLKVSGLALLEKIWIFLWLVPLGEEVLRLPQSFALFLVDLDVRVDSLSTTLSVRHSE